MKTTVCIEQIRECCWKKTETDCSEFRKIGQTEKKWVQKTDVKDRRLIWGCVSIF